jgi:hypothetical protein
VAFADTLAAADREVARRFGTAVTYVAAAGSPPLGVTGVFSGEYLDARPDRGVAAVGPAVFLLLADLVAAAGALGVLVDPLERDATVLVGDDRYRVREARLDGEGGVLLHLQEVAGP